VNLFWAIERMRRRFQREEPRGGPAVRDGLLAERQAIMEEDLASCHRMGDLGAELITRPSRILTHCNAGALATAGYGTALGVIRSAARDGHVLGVFADETRPYLQGARLTAWELGQDGIPTTLIADNMAGHMMATGQVDLVVVGADRIAGNGDVANKIGTYSVAVLAKENGIPFYVGRPRLHLRPLDRLRRADPDRGAAARRGDAPRRAAGGAGGRVRAQSRLRRHAPSLRHRDRLREGRGPGSLHREPARPGGGLSCASSPSRPSCDETAAAVVEGRAPHPLES
jgi:hypothetical protein